jgi:hypothetical protein
MTAMTFIQNFRASRKIEQEKTNANQAATVTRSGHAPIVRVMPVALAFVFMLVAVTAPVAAEINLSSITEVVNAFIGIIEPIMNLITAIIPLWFIMQILGFIMGLLGAILAMIKFGGHS